MNVTKRCAPPTDNWVGKCCHCHSEATASLADVRVDLLFQGDPLSGWATCPVCEVGGMRFRNSTVVDSEDYRSYVARRV